MNTAENTTTTNRRNKLIIIVDDNPQIARLVKREIESALRGVSDLNCSIFLTSNAYNAENMINVAIESDCGPEILITDYDLGGGLTGLDLIRKAPNTCRRILMSGDLPADTSPADIALEKPFRREELLAALRLED